MNPCVRSSSRISFLASFSATLTYPFMSCPMAEAISGDRPRPTRPLSIAAWRAVLSPTCMPDFSSLCTTAVSLSADAAPRTDLSASILSTYCRITPPACAERAGSKSPESYVAPTILFAASLCTAATGGVAEPAILAGPFMSLGAAESPMPRIMLLKPRPEFSDTYSRRSSMRPYVSARSMRPSSLVCHAACWMPSVPWRTGFLPVSASDSSPTP